MGIKSLLKKIKLDKKLFLPILIVLLAVGYAAVSTSMMFLGNVSLGMSEFDISFNRAILNGANLTSIVSEDKRTINFNYNDISGHDISSLKYELVNKNSQYDARVSVSCSSTYNDETTITYGDDGADEPVTVYVEAGSKVYGTVDFSLDRDAVVDKHEKVGTLYSIVKSQSLGSDKDINYNKVSEAGVYETTDTDSNNSIYFYRGNVENNNVLFAGKCWLILRTTETNGVKLVYNGNPVNGSCVVYETALSFGLLSRNFYNDLADDNAYVGYMYGKVGASSYEETVANTNDSNAKKVLDQWYIDNIKGTNYENFIEDTVYCNDRSLATDYTNITNKSMIYENYVEPTDDNQDLEELIPVNSLGYGNALTIYSAATRIGENVYDLNPTYKCIQSNDRFTVSKENGNGALTYPIGLLTADELVYAGANNVKGAYFLQYANSKNYNYTMTPYYFDGSAANNLNVYLRQLLSIEVNSATNYLTPVISLSSETEIVMGDGSKSDPYIIETEDVSNNSYSCTMSVEAVERTSLREYGLENLEVGDEYCIGEECFYVISNKDGVVRLLAKYNLYVGKNNDNSKLTAILPTDPLYGKQNKDAQGYTVTGVYPWIGATKFSEVSNQYEGSLAEGYVNEYIDYLKKTYGVANISGDLATKEDLDGLGCTNNGTVKTCSTSEYTWLTGRTYYLKTPDANNTIWIVGADGFYGATAYNIDGQRGIRPVISLYIEDNQSDNFDEYRNMKVYDMVKNLSLGLDTTKGINYDATSGVSNGKGVYESKDTDSGNSVYFYRGNVDNNVIYAGKCWLILRTTETNGTKLIYNGEVVAGRCINTGSETEIGKATYTDKVSDNAYVGYMYGTINSSDYNSTHTNKNDSTIKQVVDAWYEDNILNTNYENYLEDTVFCNDRQIVTPGNSHNNILTSTYTTNGFGSYTTGYGAISRTSASAMLTTPTYKCAQLNDRFTVNTKNGNGALTYPIGLLTSDEAVFAGATRYQSGSANNTDYFLYSNSKFYTMTPSAYSSGRVLIAVVNADDDKGNGYLGNEVATEDAKNGVRPVVSLSNDVIIASGKGTANSPYVVKIIADLDEDDIPFSWQDNGIFKDSYLDAYQKLLSMSLEEKVGQLMIAHHSDTAMNAITKYNVSGFTYFEADFLNKTEASVKNMIASEQALSKIPLITAVDEEGGRVVRISSTPALVSNEMSNYPNLFYTNDNNKNAWKLSHDLYEEGGYSLIEQETKVKSEVLNRLGLNVNFAPVVDMAIPGTYISDRVIGLDAVGTAEYAKTVINASKGTNVSYTLKHFPGYGNNADTHSTSSVENKTLKELMENDIVPFKIGIDNGAEAIMVAHNIVAAVDLNNPASLSKSIHELLTDDLGYTGIIITDALDMGALTNVDNKFVKAVKAGNHQMLVKDYAAAHQEIMAAINNGDLTEEEINKLVFKVLAWKYYKGLM